MQTLRSWLPSFRLARLCQHLRFQTWMLCLRKPPLNPQSPLPVGCWMGGDGRAGLIRIDVSRVRPSLFVPANKAHTAIIIADYIQSDLKMQVTEQNNHDNRFVSVQTSVKHLCACGYKVWLVSMKKSSDNPLPLQAARNDCGHRGHCMYVHLN